MTSTKPRASMGSMKLTPPTLRSVLALLFFGSATTLIACSGEDDTTGDGDGTGGTVGDGDGTGGTVGDGDGTGGTPGDGDGTGVNELPADSSQASIEAFLAAGTYKSAPWVGDAAIRAGDVVGNIHGNALQVFFNSAAVTSKTSGDTNSLTGTMVVKEMFDEAGVSIGHAVQLKTGEGNTKDDWTFYCSAPEGSTLCTGEAVPSPIYGAGLGECGYCHGQMPYADPPL